MWNMNKVYKKKATKNFIKKKSYLLIIWNLRGESTNYRKNYKQRYSQKCGITGELELGSGRKTPRVIEGTTTQKRDYYTTSTLRR